MSMDLPQRLDDPLPTELTGREHGWFGRYRRYPVFSAPWVRGRLRSAALVYAVMMALVLLAALSSSAGPDRPWPGLCELALELSVPWLAGPTLALWVRRRGWPAVREWWALVAVMALTVATVMAFNVWGAEPLKQFVAERTGGVDAHGKRKRVVMVVGVNISAVPDRMASVPGDALGPNDIDTVTGSLNFTAQALITFWMAGGWGLRTWRREREGLAALARERALAEALAQRREAELRLSVLAAQVEPHFLFNTLAGVRSAISTDPPRASEMIDRLVEYLRAAIPRLRSDGSAQATVGAQFEIVRAYLGLMAARMPRLQFSVDAEPALLKACCPPLMLISLAENAVKHGVEMKIGPAQIEVHAERTEDGRLALVVEDDGAGFGVSQAGSGLGLSNIRERLAQLHGEAASLTLKARPQGGVAATITVPLELAP
jgi:two-component sensor histidine kinase